jgi:hypothetical protein
LVFFIWYLFEIEKEIITLLCIPVILKGSIYPNLAGKSNVEGVKAIVSPKPKLMYFEGLELINLQSVL